MGWNWLHLEPKQPCQQLSGRIAALCPSLSPRVHQINNSPLNAANEETTQDNLVSYLAGSTNSPSNEVIQIQSANHILSASTSPLKKKNWKRENDPICHIK